MPIPAFLKSFEVHMASRADCPHNLSARARRGDLSADEREHLARSLQASPTLRTAYRVGLDFDQLAAVRPGDEQLVSRIADRAMSLRNARKRHSSMPRRGMAGLAAAAILISCATAFGLWHRFHADPSEAVASRSPDPGDTVTQTRRLAQRGVSPQGEAEEPSKDEPGEAEHDARATTAKLSADVAAEGTSARSPSARTPSSPRQDAHAEPAVAAFTDGPDELVTAAALFSRANSARRAGRTSDAVALFTRLQREYPRSAEAAHSHLSLGRLLLAQHAPQAALDHFSRYRGPLAEEALLGRAQALAALGRLDEERGVWRELLDRFPKSVYAARARARLGRQRGGTER